MRLPPLADPSRPERRGLLAQGQAAEAKKADQEHRPGRGLGNGRGVQIRDHKVKAERTEHLGELEAARAMPDVRAAGAACRAVVVEGCEIACAAPERQDFLRSAIRRSGPFTVAKRHKERQE
jgi:hypothetical protein